MIKEVRDELKIRHKMAVLEYAHLCGNTRKACRDFEVTRSSFYTWKKAYDADGKAGLVRKKPIARSHPRQLSPDAVEKILYLKRTCQLGPDRITWYLERYYGITTSCSSVYRTLIRNGVTHVKDSGTQNYSYSTIRQKCSRPSHTDGREVSQT